MKRLVALLFISMGFLSLLKKERTIKLQERELNKELRFITYPPPAIHDCNIIRIYSDIPLENLQETAIDLSNGAILHFNNIIVICVCLILLYRNG